MCIRDRMRAGNILLNVVRDVAIDSEGNVYVADAGNRRIIKTNEHLYVVTASWATTPGGSLQEGPGGVTVDSAGNVYFTDITNKLVRKRSKDGSQDVSWKPTGADALNIPAGLAVDYAGYVYVADRGAARITVFGPTGSVVTHFNFASN